MSNETEAGIRATFDPEALASLKRIDERLAAVGICPTAETMLGVAIGCLVRRLGADETQTLLCDWVNAMEGMSGEVTVNGDLKYNKAARRRRKS